MEAQKHSEKSKAEKHTAEKHTEEKHTAEKHTAEKHTADNQGMKRRDQGSRCEVPVWTRSIASVQDFGTIS
jgi:hypothetical protein